MMKIKRICCIAVAFMLSLMSCMPFAVLAGAADEIIIDDITSLSFANFKQISDTSTEGTTEAGKISVDDEFYDDIIDEKVIRFSSENLAENYGLYNTPGREARYFLLGKSTKFSENLYNKDEHKYVNVEFQLNPENSTDGLALRLNRYSVADDGTLSVDTLTGYYFAVGGGDFVDSVAANSNLTTGYSYTYRGLTPGKWHNITIQLGADSQTNTIRFFVDGKLVSPTEVKHVYNTTTKKVEKTTTSPVKDVYTFPEKTVGFCSRGENYSVLIPKGVKGTTANKFGLRLFDFTIKATNSEFEFDSEILPQKVFELTDGNTFIRSAENGLNMEMAQAPHFSGDLSRKVLHLYSGEGGYANGTGGYSASNYSQAGKAPGFYLINNAGETIGNIDYSNYKYLRTSFGIYLNDETNGIYFRGDNVVDGVVNNSHNYIFGIGAGSFKLPSNNSAIHSHNCRELSVGRWYNVVIEIGASGGNGVINYYIDGVKQEHTYGKLDGVSDETFNNISSFEGLGGTSQNRCIVVPKANFGTNLDIYLNNFEMVATNSKYVPGEEFSSMTITDSKNSRVKVDNGIVYSYNGLSEGECGDSFETTGADYVGVADGGKYILMYNKTYDLFKYCEIINVTDEDIPYTEGVHTDSLKVYTDGNETVVKCDAYNLSGDYSSKPKLIVTYIKDDVLVECFTKDISLDDKITYVNEKIQRKTNDFDSITAFIWSGISDMTILGEYAVGK